MKTRTRIADLDRSPRELENAAPRYQPSPEEQSRLAAATAHLTATANECGMTVDEYERAGLLAEWRHQQNDLACPTWFTGGQQ
ncbi:hypothetical protein OS965_02105 [Streptomyces sp. H27-G5]|uniref:hypothetical protein n=1 Tax=Streptomyces sp. H27-G5 TaxID=2996698 RepID=UPI00226E4562|nr:hypothetical protein [Streptomyces sp. H27-G5]MCY0916968.1 hypothetical protein [Streptomyces sp. H27-G5]